MDKDAILEMCRLWGWTLLLSGIAVGVFHFFGSVVYFLLCFVFLNVAMYRILRAAKKFDAKIDGTFQDALSDKADDKPEQDQ